MAQPKPALQFDEDSRAWLEPFLPRALDAESSTSSTRRPFVTLTYAQSLDSCLALAPGVRTALSGQETKAMTHYLRSRHDAILVGVGTALADDPALNCRLDEAVGNLELQPRPVVLDSKGQWDVENSECFRLAKAGGGKAPWIFMMPDRHCAKRDQKLGAVREIRGKVLHAPRDGDSGRFDWASVLEALADQGIESVMIEGGGSIINSLLSSQNAHLVDSVIVTVAPTWLGAGGVLVNPPKDNDVTKSGNANAGTRLKDAKWRQFGDDMVVCGYL